MPNNEKCLIITGTKAMLCEPYGPQTLYGNCNKQGMPQFVLPIRGMRTDGMLPRIAMDAIADLWKVAGGGGELENIDDFQSRMEEVSRHSDNCYVQYYAFYAKQLAILQQFLVLNEADRQNVICGLDVDGFDREAALKSMEALANVQSRGISNADIQQTSQLKLQHFLTTYQQAQNNPSQDAFFAPPAYTDICIPAEKYLSKPQGNHEQLDTDAPSGFIEQEILDEEADKKNKWAKFVNDSSNYSLVDAQSTDRERVFADHSGVRMTVTDGKIRTAMTSELSHSQRSQLAKCMVEKFLKATSKQSDRTCVIRSTDLKFVRCLETEAAKQGLKTKVEMLYRPQCDSHDSYEDCSDDSYEDYSDDSYEDYSDDDFERSNSFTPW